MRKILLVFMAVLCTFASVNAQNRTVSGTVTDKTDGLPLPGVSVLVAGAKSGTKTDENGKYSISISAGQSLQFSSLGYLTQIVKSSSSTVNISLIEDKKQLSEVVVVGYGVQSRRDVTGSYGSVSGATLADKPNPSFDQAIAGRVAGVQATQSSGILGNPVRIRIRGTNSISSGSDPLYVVDGLPIITGSQSAMGSSPNNPLGDINPNDILSIDVAKDGAATAIYGSRAAGGVVFITTKKGSAGKPKVAYNSWFSTNKAAKRFDLLHSDDFVTIANEKLTNSGAAIAAVANGTDTDWQDVVFDDKALQQNHSLSLSGASAGGESNYYFSLGYANYDGVIQANKQRKYQFFGKIEQKALANHLTFGINTNVSYTKNLGLNSGTNSLSGNVGSAIRAFPNVGPYNPDGSYNFSSDGARLGRGTNLKEIDDNYTNAAFVLNNNIYADQLTNLIGGAFSTLSIIPGLDLKTQISTNTLFGEDYNYLSPIHGDGKGSQGVASQQFSPSFRYVWTNTLGYNKTIGDHTFGAITGLEFQKSRFRTFFANGNAISSQFFGGQNIISSSFPQATFGIGGGVQEQSYKSYFVRGNYSYKNRYLLSATFRSDRISSLPTGNQTANLPGGSLGWKVSEEPFFQNVDALKFINDLKLRASVSKVGNTDIGNYPFAGTFSAATYGSQSGIAFSQAGNPDLKFETSKKYDGGLDISMFDSRVTLSADYFKNNVNNIILAAPTPLSLGVPGNSINQNIGSMTNNGVEFTLNTINYQKKTFSWSSDINLTLVKNKILTLSNNNADVAFTYNVNRVGQSIGSIYGYQSAGVNPANGNPLYVKANGQVIQGNITNQAYFNYDAANPSALTTANTLAGTDRVILGNSNPTYFGGFNNTVTFKGFDFNIFLTFSGGNKIMNVTRQESLLNQKFLNGGTELLQRWTPTNTSTSVPKLYYGRDAFTNLTATAVSRFVEDGKFIRGQNITLGYTVPASLLNKAKVSKVRIYGEVQNAFVITHYTGLDPELNFSVTTNSQAGVDYNTNPRPRSFVLGVNVGF